MKTYGGVGVQSHVFLISALDTGEWSAAHTLAAALAPEKGLPIPTG
jgi:hypothetical protein